MLIMDKFNDKINLDNLYNKTKTTNENRIKCYQTILNRIHKRIKNVSNQRNNQCFCTYIIPEFLLGLPKYDSSACTAYIIDKLKDNGFNIKYTYPNLLFISWAHYIPHYERMKYKKATGISIDGFGNIIKKKNHT